MPRKNQDQKTHQLPRTRISQVSENLKSVNEICDTLNVQGHRL